MENNKDALLREDEEGTPESEKILFPCNAMSSWLF